MVGKGHCAKRALALVSVLSVLIVPAALAATPLNAEQADRLRIQEHLSQVEKDLRQAPVNHLTDSARAARAQLLDELHDYWQAGLFPRNSTHPEERRPYFIDDTGRACAVGELIERSGHEALARRIDDTFHNDYVPDMQDGELLAWAGTHGFSVAELALIQPTYCNCDGSNWSDQADAGETLEPEAYFQPVCASNGLTYWNECIAELCGGVEVVAAGECAHEPPCELCGTGNKYAVVSECTNDAPTGICNGIDLQAQVIAVSDAVAAHWLELQNNNCASPSYVLEGYETNEGWHPSWAVDVGWECEAPTEAAGEGDSGGCASVSAPRSAWFSLAASAVVLVLVRCRRQRPNSR